MIARIIHALAHLLSWNMGRVETWWEGESLMVGFRCAGCGRLQHVQRSRTKWM